MYICQASTLYTTTNITAIITVICEYTLRTPHIHLMQLSSLKSLLYILNMTIANCQAETAQSIHWPETQPGQISVQPCFINSSLSVTASRACSLNGTWNEAYTNNCRTGLWQYCIIQIPHC